MTTTWDLTDVPAIEAADLATAVRALIDAGRGMVLLRGLTDADLDTVQADLKSRFQTEPQRALAIFVRLRKMVEVFSARRLNDMMLDKGFALMAPAIAVAASLRLNAHRGFSPQKFVASLAEVRNANVVALEPRRIGFELADQQLAA